MKTPLTLAALSFPLLFGSTPGAEEASGSFPDLGLAFALEGVEDLAPGTPPDGARALWNGKLGASDATLSLVVLESERYRLESPEDVLELMEINLQDPENTVFEKTGLLDGAFGYVCYGATGRADRHTAGTTRVAENTFFLCGMLKDSGYVLEVTCTPALSGKDAEAVRELFAEAVRYDGETANLEWTDEEATARYMQDTPEDVHNEMEKIRRTDHYIILTNSSGGKAFAKKMEEGYARIQEVFPFEEISCRKLMPVFLFQNKGEYYEFCKKIAGWSLAQAQNTKGHAWKDYYATWYEAPNDPVHVHEATHQIFANRLGLHGGGSWFQEGVAEYIETRDNDRNAAATQVKKGRSMPLREFFQVPSLVSKGSDDIKGGNQAGDLYKQAALFIEFMRESKLGEEKFLEFVHTMGRVPRGDIERIEAVFKELYDLSIEQLEEEFQNYCKRR